MSPRVVDHGQRRREIIDAYARLVAEDGVGAATTRQLASRLGIANGSLWRYFANTSELLEATLVHVLDAVNARIATHVERDSPLDAVRHVLEELMPLTPETKLEAKVVVSFWGSATSNPASHHHRGEELIEWRGLLERLLGAAVDAGELPPTLDVALTAKLLVDTSTAAQINWVLSGDGPGDPVAELDRLFAAIEAGIGTAGPRAERGLAAGRGPAG